MGLSLMLLVVAVLTALLPVAALRFRPPASIRDLEKSFVVAVVTLGVGSFVTSRLHSVGFFGLAHLLYLLAVVTMPLLFGCWYLAARMRKSSTRLISTTAGIGVLVGVLGIWGTHVEPNWLRTDRAALTAAVDQPITIGVLADLQTPNVGKHEWNAVDTLMAEEPDLVLVPGDLFQGDLGEVADNETEFVALLTALGADGATVAVVSGDSDYPLDQLTSITDASGAIFLDNQITDLVVNGQAVRLAGVPVPQSGSRLNTIAALGQQVDAFTILLAHRPDVVFDLPLGSDVDLIVSGHTHGGQISIPFIGPPVTFSDVPRSLAAGGLELVDNYPVYVSTGVGLERNAAPQIRFGVRPSVGIIELVPS